MVALNSRSLLLRIATAVFVLTSSLLAARAHVHSDADGGVVNWYPDECCNDGDCRPVSGIRHAPQGLWLTTVDGRTVLVGPKDQRRVSKDMRWHVCIVAGDADGPERIACVFEPSLAGAGPQVAGAELSLGGEQGRVP